MAAGAMKYLLRTRKDEAYAWSEPEVFATRKERDQVAAVERIIGRMRTWSYEESDAKKRAPR
jgi:hypothetical protein